MCVKKIFIIAMLAFHAIGADAQQQWGNWQTWGGHTDGTFSNPIIPADYSDLDCIKVGKNYYAISSTMQYSPGMPILHSHDLVNWEIAGNAVSDVSHMAEGQKVGLCHIAEAWA